MNDVNADLPDYPWRAVVREKDGTEHDITRELAVMYDAVVCSLDWGSGFLDAEDAAALFRVARLCGFDIGSYSVESALVPVLVDAEGRALTDPSTEIFRRSWADRTLTTHGELLHARGMEATRNGVAVGVSVAQRHSDSWRTYSLDEPIPVQTGERIEVKVNLP